MKGLIETEEEIKIEILKRWHAMKNPEHIHFENLYFKSLKRSHPELTEEQIKLELSNRWNDPVSVEDKQVKRSVIEAFHTSIPAVEHMVYKQIFQPFYVQGKWRSLYAKGFKTASKFFFYRKKTRVVGFAGL